MSNIDSKKGLILSLTKSGDNTFSKEEARLPEIFSSEPWPRGVLGDLHILNGQTISFSAGSILDYNNVTIDAGGVLNIDGSVNQKPLILGVAGNFVLNGEIRGTYFGVNSAFTIQTPTNEEISHSIVQKMGGFGGRGGGAGDAGGGYGINGPGAGGSAGTLGFGGGGGGAGSNVVGGAGGTNNGPGNLAGNNWGPVGTGNSTLGNGATAFGGTAGNGGGSGGGASGGVQNPGGAAKIPGAGGGGGYKGRHALSVYVYIRGTISGSGIINMAGTNGFSGGISTNNYSFRGTGGGGGGGAGGSGGNIWIRKSSSQPLGSISLNVSGGSGGIAGSPAAPTSEPLHAMPGENAQAGDSGSINIVDVE
jgi:hypothetical protein